jgi:DNA-directed RNA polymerase
LEYGGYLTNINNKKHYIHKSYKNVGETKFINNDMIDTLNYLQSIPFIINTELLDYLILCINNNFDFGELLSLELHPETKILFKFNLLKKEKIVKNILKLNSLNYENKCHISMAMLFRNFIFYHPLFIDWRGRIYTNSNILSELSRSLIMFKNGVVLNNEGIESLKIYLANCFGVNKLSINNRLN